MAVVDNSLELAFALTEPPEVNDNYFKENWKAYQGVLAGDHLEHRLLYSGVVQECQKLKGVNYSLLDLGCGDCQYLGELFRQVGQEFIPSSYTGVDLSGTALQVAPTNLVRALRPESFTLVEKDMLSFLQASAPQSYDVVFSSFAVHHLSVPDKLAVVAAVARALKPGGMFLFIDVFRRDGQNRSEYMEEYIQHILNEWTACTPEQRQVVVQHVTHYDFPEEVALYQEAAAPYFKTVEVLRTARYARCMIFRL